MNVWRCFWCKPSTVLPIAEIGMFLYVVKRMMSVTITAMRIGKPSSNSVATLWRHLRFMFMRSTALSWLWNETVGMAVAALLFLARSG